MWNMALNCEGPILKKFNLALKKVLFRGFPWEHELPFYFFFISSCHLFSLNPSPSILITLYQSIIPILISIFKFKGLIILSFQVNHLNSKLVYKNHKFFVFEQEKWFSLIYQQSILTQQQHISCFIIQKKHSSIKLLIQVIYFALDLFIFKSGKSRMMHYYVIIILKCKVISLSVSYLQ